MSKREYNQYCAAARALDVLGERWTLLLIRELLIGPRRYTDLLKALPGIGTNLLANRLKGLEAAGVVQRSELPPPAASSVYELTERGSELEESIVALARWGLPLLEERRPNDAWEPEWSILAMRATFRPEAAKGVHEEYEFEVGGKVFFAAVNDGDVSTGPGAAKSPAVTLRADIETFLAVANGSMPMQAAIESGRYVVDGDEAAFERCLRIFSLPERIRPKLYSKSCPT